jgi:hypothetical protein
VGWQPALGTTLRSTPRPRAAFMDRFEREVDPTATLPAEERTRRAVAARRAHFVRLALRSAEVRRKRV